MAKLTPEEKEIRKEERRLKKYYETHKIVNDIEHKLCKKCNEWFPCNEDYFYTNKNNKSDGLYPYCKPCGVKSAAQWAKDNPERRSILKSNYDKRHPHIQQMKKDWNKKNVESGRYKEWQRNNPDKIKQYNLFREMNKKHEISTEERLAVKQYFNFECAYCGISESKSKEKYNNQLHMDHVDPNGANDLSNNIPACKKCNSHKHQFSLEEWYTHDKEFYNEVRLEKINKWLENDYKLYITTVTS